MTIRVIGLGSGGHARVLLEVVRLSGKYEIIGMLDRNPDLAGKDVLGVPILGNDELLPRLAQDIQHFFVGLGSVGATANRTSLYKRAIAAGMLPIDIIHPSAVISPSSDLGAGIAVLAGAVINACVVVGVNVIINTGAIVEHDALIGNHVHIATGARLCGGVCVGSETHIGAGSIVLQGVKIGANSIVGAGAVVIRDVPSEVTIAGVPAKIIKSIPRGMK
jgi:sugar O-acyltransferase (sialic acid O-acetyltransferase NeuD family)